jgi:hypothetical protein
MRHTGFFKSFLTDVVNLNQNRIDLLDGSIEAIKTFVRDSDYQPRVRGFVAQGSWAHNTIIRPATGTPFDADLLVRVSPVQGWEAKDYVNKLRDVFKASGTYKDKVSTYSHCVTVTYAGERKIDIAPLVIDREGEGKEVCNRQVNDFEDSDPETYTSWFNQRNGWSGSNSFRKVTRLLKYLRASKRTFSCPSVLLTTMIGGHIHSWDKGCTGFEDTPSTLKTLIGRLDDWLQLNEEKPEIPNPSMTGEDFGDLISDAQYSTLRDSVHRYRGWIDEAFEESDFDASVFAWRRVFGDDFAKGATLKVERSSTLVESASTMVAHLLNSVAKHSDGLVEFVRNFGTSHLPPWFNNPPHLQPPTWRRAGGTPIHVQVSATHHRSKDGSGAAIRSGEVVPARGGIWFEARSWAGAPVGPEYRVQWRITNTGVAALTDKCGRGFFYPPTSGNRLWEGLQYRGVHIAEAFLIRWADDVLVGQSEPFHVVIE